LPARQERFWAKLAARQAIAHAERNGHKYVTVRAGASPSGPKHIGNMNDQVRGHFIRKSVDELGMKDRHILTSDDMDPLRTVPSRIPDGEGIWREPDERAKRSLVEGLGKPVCNVPDPFGCHRSYSDHFTKLMMEDLEAIGVELTLRLVSDLYREGVFDEFTAQTLERRDKVREVLRRFQSRIPENWVPLNPVCEECGKLTTRVTSVDTKGGTVEYECVGRVLHSEYRVKGCGHKGASEIGRAKLPWRLEWVADWKIFETDVEPFGKEHYEGSWKSGVALAKEVYGFEPPVPLVYEFFLIDGQKMSSRFGNVYLVRDLLEITEPEVVRYLYVKKPLVQRDIAVKKVSATVSEFDEIERLAYFDKGERADEARVYYWYVVGEPKGHPPYRLPYDVATYVTRFYAPDVALSRLERSGLIPSDLPKRDKRIVLDRLSRAKKWNASFGEIWEAERETELRVDGRKTLEALRSVREGYASADMTGDELQALFYKAARDAGIPPSELFRAGYRLFLGRDSGPRLGNFLATLDKDYVLRRIGSAKLKSAN